MQTESRFPNTMIWVGFAMILVGHSLGIILKHVRRSRLGARAPAVPSHIPLGFGVALQIVKNLRTNTVLEWTRETLNVPGRTVEVPMPGTNMIMTDDVENIRAVIATQFDCFGKGDTYHKIWSSLMRDSILTTDGHAWQTTKIRPTDYAVTDWHTQNLVRILSDGSPHGTLDLFNRFAIDVVSDIFYGTSTSTLLTNDQSLRDAIQRHKDVNTWRLLFGKLGARIPPDRRACDVIDKYLNSVIGTFSPENSSSQDERDRKARTLLGTLSGEGVSRKVLKDQLVAVLVGGRYRIQWLLHSHGYSMNWSDIRMLWKNYAPRSPQRPSDPPTPTQLEEMQLLNGVVKETLRIHTSVGINSRTALKDTTLPTGGGPPGKSPVAVLRGTPIIMGFDSVHHRTDLFGADASIYNPHRWDRNWKPNTWTYLPFNRGMRPCLGKSLSLMEVKFVLCRLLQGFSTIDLMEKSGANWVPATDKTPPLQTKMAFNTKPAEIVWLRFCR
ncbi:cytochrome P450 [Lophiostoma macrostomum CBS 122681]|uniref:Cytochrome P450 n=1 Tax=Lophiostoma macrostomum CBS 122681 TaxID=1314788 RepID=A0A6A6SXI2_9PLEO|nr:cytochrome P450 [Lophiostoma macrostomum CBS 122681]